MLGIGIRFTDQVLLSTGIRAFVGGEGGLDSPIAECKFISSLFLITVLGRVSNHEPIIIPVHNPAEQ